MYNATVRSSVVPTLSFKSDDFVVGESDGVAEVCIILSVPMSIDLTVVVTSSESYHATGKSDICQDLLTFTSYVIEGGLDFIEDMLLTSFEAGSTEACVNFTILPDVIALEGEETFAVNLFAPYGTQPGSQSPSTVTIIDDDGMLWTCP